MLRQFMNSGSLLSLILREGDNEQGNPKDDLRALLAKNTIVTAGGKVEVPVTEEVEESEPKEEDEEETPELDADGNPIVKEEPEEKELTDEEKAEAAKLEKEAAKAKRKDDRMQRRIDEATADKNKALEEIAALKAQLAANPDKTLTEEEVQSRAEAIAAKKLADKQLDDIQAEFQKDCDSLQKAGVKLDIEFNNKIEDMAKQFGPIPSFMIGVLSDLDNGAEVLVYLSNDDAEAERIYGFKNKTAKLTTELVKIANTLADAKKPKPKPVSRVPNPIAPVNGRNVQSTQITEADTKPEGMSNYIRKRQAQMEQRRKERGF